MPSAVARLVWVWWVPCLSLALAWAASLTPLHQRLEGWAWDAQQRLAAPKMDFSDVVVVEIDEPSVRELGPFFGARPWPRDSYALVLDYLGDLGARSVAFDILFSDPRAGDEQFQRALTHNRNAILAASALNHAESAGGGAQLGALAWRPTTPMPAMHWTALALPLARFAEPVAGGRVGMISVAVDEDGVLRRMPLMHDIGGAFLPSLPLAALFPGRTPPLAFLPEQRLLSVGNRSWPVDADGAVRLLFPRNVDALPVVSFSLLAGAALGMSDKAVDPAQFAGKTVFVGDTALFSDRVTTPRGVMNGVHVMAIAHQALLRGLVLKPLGWRWAGLLLVLAAVAGALPGVLRRPTPAIAGLTGLAAAVAVVGVSFAAFAFLQRQGTLLLPLFAIALATALNVALAVRGQYRRRAEEALARAEAETELAVKQQRFVAMVSHEFRSPLAIIDASLQSLKRLARDAPDDVLSRHRKIQRASRRLEALISNHLTEDRLRRAAQPPRMEPVALDGLLAGIARRAEWPDLQIDLDSLGATLEGDVELLRIAFSNLLDNAMKYSPDGGAIRIDGDVGEHTVEVRVSDSGIGIAPQDLERVFDRYFRAAGVKAAGSGLGLHLVRQIVELHGGTIRAQSEPGHGTRMSVRLPLAGHSPHTLPAADISTGSAKT